MFTFKQNGAVIDVTVSAATTIGSPVKIADDFYGIAVRDIANGATGAVRVDGVYDAVASGAITAGAVVYLDSNGKVNATAASGTKIGIALNAASASGDIVHVHLNKGVTGYTATAGQ